MYAVVVLPLVPVIPMVINDSDGRPNHSFAINARALRSSSTRTTVTPAGTSTSFVTTTADAPAATAWGMKECPSTTVPAIHTNTSPPVIFRLSEVTPVTGISAEPDTIVCGTSASNALKSFRSSIVSSDLPKTA